MRIDMTAYYSTRLLANGHIHRPDRRYWEESGSSPAFSIERRSEENRYHLLTTVIAEHIH